MSTTTRSVVPLSAVVLLLGCDADRITSTTRNLEFVATVAARATTAAFTTSALSSGTIRLTWPDNSPNEAGWEVHRSTNGPTGTFTLRASLESNTSSYDDGDLAPLTQYCYKVRSFKTTGRTKSYASFTAVSCSTTHGAPVAPSGLTARPSSSSRVQVSWTNNTTDALGIRVERSVSGGAWSALATVEWYVASYTDATLSLEQPACYRAVAFNSAGPTASTTACTAIPAEPTNVRATGRGSGIDLTWTDASGVEDGYVIYRQQSSQNGYEIATVPANTTTYRDLNVLPDVYYFYRVRALKDGGSSDYSETVAGVAASRPPTEPWITVSPGGSTQALVNWSDLSGVGATTRIERSPDGASGWVILTSSEAPSGSYYDADRTPDAQVCYRVYAINSMGEAASQVDCTTPPRAPTNVAVTLNEEGAFLVSWTDNSSVESEYQIWYSWCDNYGCYSDYRIASANMTSVTLPTDVWIDGVFACVDGGCSDPGEWASSPSAVSASRTNPAELLDVRQGWHRGAWQGVSARR